MDISNWEWKICHGNGKISMENGDGDNGEKRNGEWGIAHGIGAKLIPFKSCNKPFTIPSSLLYKADITFVNATADCLSNYHLYKDDS